MFPESLCLELCVGQSVTRSSEAEGGGGLEITKEGSPTFC